MKGQSVRRFSRTTATIALTVALSVLFIAGADMLQRHLAIALKRQSVADLAQSALTRAEIATDYAVIRLGVLNEEGNTDCSPEAIQALNYAVFRSGTIKDILTAKNGNVCSVAMHSETLARNHANPVDSATARNPNIVLNPLRINMTAAMAVTWHFNKDTLATALVNTESLVFDLLPADLRDRSAIKLSLSNGRTVGRFDGPEWQVGIDTEMFEVTSDRYPLAVRIHVPTTLLRNLDMKFNIASEAAISVLAVLLAWLVSRGLVPATSAASRIRHALKRDEIVPHFQPAYDVRTGDVTGFEVLARWPGQTGPIASPAFFVPLIEANGWANNLLESMVMQSAQAMQPVMGSADDIKLGFNVSPAQIVDPTFAGWLKRVLQRAELDPSRVIIEITEREEIVNLDTARETIAALGDMGIAVAIDDAGTGHNGLASVQRLGASILKIDKLFVDGIGQDPRAGALVQMLVDVAHEYGMRTVAEGVENESQLDALRGHGVDSVQGFYLCRPLEAEAAVNELARHQAVLARERMQQKKAKEEAIATGKVVALNA